MDTSSTSSTADKCLCDHFESVSEQQQTTPNSTKTIPPPPPQTTTTTTPSNSKEKKSKLNIFNFQNFASKCSKKSATIAKTTIKKSPNKWKLKINCTKRDTQTQQQKSTTNNIASDASTSNNCTCTCFRQLDAQDQLEASTSSTNSSSTSANSSSSVLLDHASNQAQTNSIADILDNVQDSQDNEDERFVIYGTGPSITLPNVSGNHFADIQWLRTVHEDCDEAARVARAVEIAQGVEAPENFRPVRRVQVLCSDSQNNTEQAQGLRLLQLVCPPDLSVESLRALFQDHVTLRSCPLDTITGCHTQVDFIHCLVPDLLDITNCSFYWGKMDRYEAEKLLEGKQEGTFLLRDSAQEEFLFSVSFRKYGRSLHARIEQWNHMFSFDAHDPGVYTSDTVCGLIEHYKDPSSCMFFEPVLTLPLHRKTTFSLQHLARASIVSKLTYDNINLLQLPKTLKNYLKEYHYRQKVRVERFDDDVQWLELRNNPL